MRTSWYKHINITQSKYCVCVLIDADNYYKRAGNGSLFLNMSGPNNPNIEDGGRIFGSLGL